MTIPIISRRALLRKMTNIVNKLPDEKLQQLWQRFATWEAMSTKHINGKTNHSDANEQEVIEFTVASRQGTGGQFVRLPIRFITPVTRANMEVGDLTSDAPDYMQQLQANLRWWNQNFATLYTDTALYNRYVAISEGAVFCGDSYLETYYKARQAHKDGVPYIFFLKSPHELPTYAY